MRQLGYFGYLQHGIVVMNEVFGCISGKAFKLFDEMHLIEIAIFIGYIGQFGVIHSKKLIYAVLKAMERAIGLG